VAVDYRRMPIIQSRRAIPFMAAVAVACLLMAHDVGSQAPKERVRVPTSHANIHMSAGSGSEVLVLAPKGTILTVLARKGEWIQVQLPPELRKTGLVMRWYKNETSGWMHDSTVVPADPKSP
jgi:hypothetical protein